ncbi:MAG: peptide deformylase [Desulfoarculaceae bacterium]|nr:peptide deformylase [Desulfoarculaceae bacterium]
MAIRTILEFPHPVLRQKASPISVFNEELKDMVADMTETMYDAPGIGLAAPQIGESIQLIVVDVAKLEAEQQVLVMINPRIISQEGSQVDEEGCLSVIDLTANVKRFQKITVTYQDLDGNLLEISTEDRFAVVLQHEIDHLHGVLFIDHLSALKRTLYKKKVQKMLTEKKA